jgi:hypothetical protein
MNSGVPQTCESLLSDSFAASRPSRLRVTGQIFRVALLLTGLMTLAPGIAAGQSPSTRSCKKAAFTGRVGSAQPARCQRHATPALGPPGPRGDSGARGPTGFAGLPGPGGNEGFQGLTGTAGSTGLTGLTGTAGAGGAPGSQGSSGLTGLPGLPGAEGAPGSKGLTGLTGLTGLPGLPGAEGAPGSKGLTGLTGLTGAGGAPGSEGPIGLTGTTGAGGAPGSAGPIGLNGTAGPPGSAGPIGLTGAVGPTGPTGPQGPVGLLAYAEFFALMPPDNTATVGSGIPVQFPQNGPTAGVITRRGGPSSPEFVLPNIGKYRVAFSVSVDEAGQLVLALDSGGGMVELAYTVYGRATGTSQISGEALVTTTVANSALELRNPTGNTPALTVTPKAGGTHAAVASIVIQQLG